MFWNSSELQALLRNLELRERTAVLLDAASGLRVSELLALRWRDVDFENLELRVARSIWHQVIGECKTEASAKPVPLDSYLAEDLLRWRRISPYPMPGDRIFASPFTQGKQPYWPDNLMKRYIRPAARNRHQQKHRLAYLPSLFRDSAESEWGRYQDRSGATTARQRQDHA